MRAGRGAGHRRAAPDLFTEFEDAPPFSTTRPTSTGDHLRMARDGGALQRLRGRRHRPAPTAEPLCCALQGHGVTPIAFSGADVDGGLRVRHPDCTPIEGPHAAGEVLGAFATSGMPVTPALTFGRLLGAEPGRRSAARPRAG